MTTPADRRCRPRSRAASQRGNTLLIAVLISSLFAAFGVVAVNAAHQKSILAIETLGRIQAEAAAQSRVNYALAQVRRGGVTALSETGAFGRVPSTDLDVVTNGNVVTVRARAALQTGAAGLVTVHARAILVSFRFVPGGPLHFGNGAVERPRGNLGGHSPDSYISDALDLSISAWNHPRDFLANPVAAPPQGDPRWYDQDPQSPFFGQAFSVFEAQNPYGQQNITDWLDPWSSGGTSYDPTSRIQGPLDAGYQPFPIVSNVPDVATFAYELWAHPREQDVHLSQAVLAEGSYVNGGFGADAASAEHPRFLGTVSDPRVVFVTGRFENVQPFKGAGILVIRDDYDPAVGGSRDLAAQASLAFRSDFEWTGLVIVAGCAPEVSTRGMPGGAAVRINGALMGEDSVQSGSETSLENATVQLYVGSGLGSSSPCGPLELSYSADVFAETLPGGAPNPMYALLPTVEKRLATLNTSVGPMPLWPLPAAWTSN